MLSQNGISTNQNQNALDDRALKKYGTMKYMHVLLRRRQSLEVPESFLRALKDAGFEYHLSPDSNTRYDFGISLGGDGTFLTLANDLRGTDTPILGVNFGNVGFLTDLPSKSITDVPQILKSGEYTLERRNTIDVQIEHENGEVEFDWALNDATLEKAGLAGERYGMLNVRLEIDDVPLSKYGCDGIVVSSSTGSTAHAFSANGPVIWPSVDCFEVIPVAAHALFTRPVILGGDSTVKLIVDESPAGFATLLCDGHRAYKLSPRSEVTIKRGKETQQFVRTQSDTFTSRLVSKFQLPVDGWSKIAD